MEAILMRRATLYSLRSTHPPAHWFFARLDPLPLDAEDVVQVRSLIPPC